VFTGSYTAPDSASGTAKQASIGELVIIQHII